MSDKPKEHLVSHLKKYQWKPGQSGNPHGRRKNEYCLTTLLRARIAEPCSIMDPHTGKPRFPDMTWGQVLVQQMLMLACSGKAPQLMKEIFDRLDGRVTLPIESSGPITVVLSEDYKPEGLTVDEEAEH